MDPLPFERHSLLIAKMMYANSLFLMLVVNIISLIVDIGCLECHGGGSENAVIKYVLLLFHGAVGVSSVRILLGKKTSFLAPSSSVPIQNTTFSFIFCLETVWSPLQGFVVIGVVAPDLKELSGGEQESERVSILNSKAHTYSQQQHCLHQDGQPVMNSSAGSQQTYHSSVCPTLSSGGSQAPCETTAQYESAILPAPGRNSFHSAVNNDRRSMHHSDSSEV